MPDPTPTARVRIAVCVDEEGNYSAMGRTQDVDDEARIWAEDNHEGPSWAMRHVVWVEADVPLPARVEPTVRGEVVKTSQDRDP